MIPRSSCNPKRKGQQQKKKLCGSNPSRRRRTAAATEDADADAVVVVVKTKASSSASVRLLKIVPLQLLMLMLAFFSPLSCPRLLGAQALRVPNSFGRLRGRQPRNPHRPHPILHGDSSTAAAARGAMAASSSAGITTATTAASASPPTRPWTSSPTSTPTSTEQGAAAASDASDADASDAKDAADGAIGRPVAADPAAHVRAKKQELLHLLLLELPEGRRRRGHGPTDAQQATDPFREESDGAAIPYDPPRAQQHGHYWERVAACINELEALYVCPPQTVDFFNFAVAGAWDHALCTRHVQVRAAVGGNAAAAGDTASSNNKEAWKTTDSVLRIEGIAQEIRAVGRNATVRTSVSWWLQEEELEPRPASRDDADTPPPAAAAGAAIPDQCIRRSCCSGTFDIVADARMSPSGSSRQHWSVVDRVLELGRGSDVPPNVPQLVRMLQRHTPLSLFDPDGAAMDTTYLDADVRIVRYTGMSRLEGVRDVFVRRYNEHQREEDAGRDPHDNDDNTNENQ
jgi:hypothetical protein